MGWRELLIEEPVRSLPWIGGRGVCGFGQHWKIVGSLPQEHGWHQFLSDGTRKTTWQNSEPSLEAPLGLLEGQQGFPGYLVGNRVIPDGSRVTPEPEKIFEQSLQVHLVPPGQARFSRCQVIYWEQQFYLFGELGWPLGPEEEVNDAFINRRDSVSQIKGVTPALDLAFRFESLMRSRYEDRIRRLEEQRRQEQERIEKEAREAAEREERLVRQQQLINQLGTGAGRRQMATVDFARAAQAALAISGAVLLDSRPSYHRGEHVVLFRHEQRRFECVVDQNLHVVDAGICLEGNDRLFTLESLPGVISEATRTNRLHIFRHTDNEEDD